MGCASGDFGEMTLSEDSFNCQGLLSHAEV